MIKVIHRKLRGWYRRKFQNKNYVFRHDGPYPVFKHPEFRFERYATFEDVPLSARDSMLANGGTKSLENFRREMDDHAVLWLAMIGDCVVGRCMSRTGRFFRDWFVPLADNDVVIFRGSTDPDYRGRGISPSLTRHIMATELACGGKAFADCRVYNAPSIRGLEKSGFTLIATMKPISRESALGNE